MRIRSEAVAARATCAVAGAAAAAAVILWAPPAAAQDPAQPPPGFEQQPPQPQPPPTYGQPPPGYGYPPPGYGYGVPASPVLGPKKLDYEEGDPIPPGYHVETKMRKGLLIGGAVTFGACYLFSAFAAATIQTGQDITGSSRDEYGPLYIPAAGPFITIGTAHSRNGGTFLLILDGVAQSGGLVMAIMGIVAQNTILVRNDVGKALVGDEIGATGMRLGPMAVGADVKGTPTMGFGLVGKM